LEQMTLPTSDDARRLLEWAPPHGVVSVYLRLEPDDRGGAWRTELRNGLAGLRATEGLDHDTAVALRATAERIEERFANHERSLPRGEVGFVEVAAKSGAERWWTSHLEPGPSSTVALDPRPLVAPLVCLLGRGATRGVALLSAERVRLLEWAPRQLEELHNWELSVFSLDWRDSKAPRVPDPARGQSVSASGHDQFDERLADNRRRFLGECGRLAAQVADERGWGRLLLFGAPEHRRELCHGLPAPELAADGGDADLISEPSGRLEVPIAAAAERLEGERERALVERALSEARGGSRGAAGAQETAAALAEARVECLVLDAARAVASEGLVRAALESGAEMSAVANGAAEPLAEVEGVAALLRY
jgi:Bacterial archaeo-eukaryotic release factor family 10